MPKGRNNFITSTLQAWAPQFYAETGRMPTMQEVVDRFPQMVQHKNAVTKALTVIEDRLPPPILEAGARVRAGLSEAPPIAEPPAVPLPAPKLSAPDPSASTTARDLARAAKAEIDAGRVSVENLPSRIEAARMSLRALYSNAEQGLVDALGIDRLERLLRQLEQWRDEDADRARLEQAKREGPPVWNAMLRDYEERRLMGDSAPKPRGEVTDGEAKYGQH